MAGGGEGPPGQEFSASALQGLASRLAPSEYRRSKVLMSGGWFMETSAHSLT